MSELRKALPKIVTDSLPGPKAADIIKRREAAIPNGIRCGYPLVAKRGEGAMLEDVDGNVFLDWVGGVGVLNVGYSQPEMIAAVKEQADRFFHIMMNIETHEGYIALAEKMNSIVPVRGEKKKTMFVNSGAEADENAVKIAKQFTGRPNIIVFSGAFHGRTAMTMAMTSKKAYAYGMGPFPDGVYRAEFPYLYRKPKGYTAEEAIEYYIGRLKAVFEEASPAQYVAAIVVEPVQGEGGIYPAEESFLKGLRKICDEKDILLVFDEIQCGMGRTGYMFAWQKYDVQPDIMTCAKALGCGVPVGAFVLNEKVAKSSLVPGDHGTTYGGNPFACAAVSKVFDLFEELKITDHVQKISVYLEEKLDALAEKSPYVATRRGAGLMQGLVIKDKAVGDVVKAALAEGLITISAGSDVLRLVPPLVIKEAHVDEMIEKLEKVLL